MAYTNIVKGAFVDKRKITILALAIIGFITTIKLAIIFYNANFNEYALSSFCSINSFIDCDSVAKTIDSQFLGVPLAYWGMLFYLIVIFLMFVDKLKNIKFLNFLSVFKNPYTYISILGLFSFLVSIVLAVKSIFFIRKLCVLCLFTYFLNLFIGLLAFETAQKGLITQLKEFFLDIFDGIKKYPVTTVVITAITVCFLTYTATTYVFTPNVKRIKSVAKFAKMKTNPYKISGNILGDKDGKVTVELYSDFVCPICYIYNLMIHKAMTEISNIKIEHHNFPLDKNCNKYVRVQMHNGACRMARYGIAAENQDKYWDMATELFENHPKNDEEAIELAKKLNMDIAKFKNDINSEETKKKLFLDIDKARDTYALNGTPALAINKKLYMGIKPYYELKELLIEAGGYAK